MQKNLYNEAGNCINCTDAGYDEISENDHIHTENGGGCRMFIGLCLVVLLVIAVCITRTFYK